MTTLFRKLSIALLLLASAGMAHAEDEELCSSFRDGVVDESLLSVMMSAAKQGHLYRIQPSSSRVGFCVDSKLKRIEGSFGDFNGGITLDSKENSNGQTMVLIHTSSLDTKGPMVKTMLMSENFFDVKHYPEIVFVSHSFTWKDADTALLKGDLTLRGITRPVTFNVKLTRMGKGHGDAIDVKATTRINREEFGMDKLKSLADSEVHLCINAQAKKYHEDAQRPTS